MDMDGMNDCSGNLSGQHLIAQVIRSNDSSICVLLFSLRYKCPKCRTPFCCVQCSKEHKNQCPATTVATNNLDNTVATRSGSDVQVDTKSQYLPSAILKSNQAVRKRKRTKDEDQVDSEDDEPGFNITTEMKTRLEQSPWLRKELQDGGLQCLISMIDAASDDEQEDGDKKHFNHKKSRGGTNKYEGITPRVLALARSKSSHPKFASFIDQMLLTAGVLQPVEGAESEGQLSLVPVTRRSAGLSMNGDSSEGSDSDEESSSSDESSDSDGNSSSSEEVRDTDNEESG